MTFRVGMKVVCVREPINPIKEVVKIRVGAVYTVRELYLSFIGSRPGIRLAEITNPLHPITGTEYGYFAARFRPIVERKTDIGFAHEILRKLTTRVNA